MTCSGGIGVEAGAVPVWACRNHSVRRRGHWTLRARPSPSRLADLGPLSDLKSQSMKPAARDHLYQLDGVLQAIIGPKSVATEAGQVLRDCSFVGDILWTLGPLGLL